MGVGVFLWTRYPCTEMCSGSEAGSYLRLTDEAATPRSAQGCFALGTLHSCADVRTGSWMGPPQGKRAPRVGPISIVIFARECEAVKAMLIRPTQRTEKEIFSTTRKWMIHGPTGRQYRREREKDLY